MPQQQPITSSPEDAKVQGPDWKRQLAERVDAYRSKHPDAATQPSSTTNTHADSRASKIARSVASRYAAAPTYRELLLAAAEAEKAAAEAQAVLAERAERDARIELDAQIAQEKIAQDQIAASQRNAELAASGSPDNSQAAAIRTQPGTPVMPQFAARNSEMHAHQSAPEPEPSLEDLWASALVEPRAWLPSKLIEFPRELVSSRRARPHLPETPDRETGSAALPPEPAQLRIFEVQSDQGPDQTTEVAASKPGSNFAPASSESAPQNAPNDTSQISTQNAAQAAARKSDSAIAGKVSHTLVNRSEAGNSARTSVPSYRRSVLAARPEPVSNASTTRSFKSLEWAAISLDKEPATRSRQSETSVADSVPFLVDPAPIDRRLMAFAVDFAAVTAGFLGFLVVFVASTPHLPTGFTAVALAGAVYAALWLLYQVLFFSFSGATAGMLYARIALCTFDDRNPTRPALRRRLAAWWLSCLPLGIGFLWCFVDEDNLSWHDRMTRMYQRGY
jgi:uncharacterized RDD family membrane protein YckC